MATCSGQEVSFQELPEHLGCCINRDGLRNEQNAGRDLSLNLQGSQKPTSLLEAMIQYRVSKASLIVGLVSLDFYGAWN